jgi:hypothetical protein
MMDRNTSDAAGDVSVRARVSDLDDLELERRARAAFGRYRRMRNRGGFHPDAAYIAELVELQHEYLRRFPAGDLSVGSRAPGGATANLDA